jgi:hypothetical protein
MAARTMPTMPNFTANMELTSSIMNQITTYVTFWANPPDFRMYQGTVQTPATGSLVQITMDTSEYDSDSGRGAGTPWSYTIPLGMAGRWTFTACVAWNANATGMRATVLYQNGAQAPGAYVAIPASPAGFVTAAIVTATLPVNAGDTIAVYGSQSSGGGLATFSSAGIYSYFEGRMEGLGSP